MIRICTKRISFSLKVLRIVRVSGPLKDGYVIKITSEDCEYQVQQRTESKAREKEPACNASSLAITSAKSFNLSCSGVFSESRRKAINQNLSDSLNARRDKERTHHDTTVETFRSTEITMYEPTPSTNLLPLTMKQSV